MLAAESSGDSFMHGHRIWFFPALALLVIHAATSAMVSAAPAKEYEREVRTYDLPDVALLSQDRETVELRDAVRPDKPVLLEFIFASCQGICPVMSAGFSNFQRELGDETGQVRLISISIDPEYDTPEVMKKYLGRYKAQPGWDFLTGDPDDIQKVLLGFDLHVADKMEHEPLTFLRAPGQEEWVRLNGLLTGSQLKKEFDQLMKP
jgi:protein SCO1/2